jgi:acyl-coenzyme A thioesterase PaaI-like protein
MATAKMSVTELEAFLPVEFPQAFLSGDICIESADGITCLLRQRYSDQMLRPGAVLGPSLMALADCVMYVAALGHRPSRDRQPQYFSA